MCFGRFDYYKFLSNKNTSCNHLEKARKVSVALDGSSVSGSISGCRITGCVIMSHFPKGVEVKWIFTSLFTGIIKDDL